LTSIRDVQLQPRPPLHRRRRRDRPLHARFERGEKQFGKIEKTVGVLLVATGVAFLTGGFQSASLWLIETFPQFGLVG
jgi:cytochrome c-type biogenesis protein